MRDDAQLGVWELAGGRRSGQLGECDIGVQARHLEQPSAQTIDFFYLHLRAPLGMN
jgi:hypothetical protein